MKLGKKKKTAAAKDQVAFKHYDVIKAPVITEKSTMASEQNKIVFKVAQTAGKEDIKAAVEALFNVKVVGVNTLNRKGKNKTFRGTPGKQADIKKAIVTLEPGQSIDVAMGVK